MLVFYIYILMQLLTYSDCCDTFIPSPISKDVCEDVAKQPKNNLKGIKGRVREHNSLALQSMEDG